MQPDDATDTMIPDTGAGEVNEDAVPRSQGHSAKRPRTPEAPATQPLPIPHSPISLVLQLVQDH